MKHLTKILAITATLGLMAESSIAGHISLFDYSYNIDGVESAIGLGDAVPGSGVALGVGEGVPGPRVGVAVPGALPPLLAVGSVSALPALPVSLPWGVLPEEASLSTLL